MLGRPVRIRDMRAGLHPSLAGGAWPKLRGRESDLQCGGLNS